MYQIDRDTISREPGAISREHLTFMYDKEIVTLAAYMTAPMRLTVAIQPIHASDIRDFCSSQPYIIRPWIMKTVELSPKLA